MFDCKTLSLFGFLLATCLASVFDPVAFQETREPQTIRRVRRPEFSESEADRIYLRNLFAEALVGPRPEKPLAPTETAIADAPPGDSNGSGWSQFVTSEIIEDEIKLIYRQLQTDITTPSRFNGQISRIRQQFNMLSMLFGIVHEYDRDIRWKEYAGSAQLVFAETAARAKTASTPAFENAKLRKDDLGELIRGGSIAIKEGVPAKLEWPNVIERRSMMARLDEGLGSSLQPGTVDASGFAQRKDELQRQAYIVLAISRILTQDGMEDAGDDGYVEYARSMGTAATDVLAGIRDDNFESTTRGVKAIEKSCAACHGDWL